MKKLVYFGLPFFTAFLLIAIVIGQENDAIFSEEEVSEITNTDISLWIESLQERVNNIEKNDTSNVLNMKLDKKENDESEVIINQSNKAQRSSQVVDISSTDISIDVDVPVAPQMLFQSDNIDKIAASDSESAIEQKKIMEDLDNRVYSQAYDNEWAGEMESNLYDTFFEKSLSGSDITESVCRTTLCRVEVIHASPNDEQEFVSAFAISGKYLNDGDQGSYHRLVDNNGNIRSVYYLAREGYDLSSSSL